MRSVPATIGAMSSGVWVRTGWGVVFETALAASAAIDRASRAFVEAWVADSAPDAGGLADSALPARAVAGCRSVAKALSRRRTSCSSRDCAVPDGPLAVAFTGAGFERLGVDEDCSGAPAPNQLRGSSSRGLIRGSDTLWSVAITG
jgi:hypothetical protein